MIAAIGKERQGRDRPFLLMRERKKERLTDLDESLDRDIAKQRP